MEFGLIMFIYADDTILSMGAGGGGMMWMLFVINENK
jgi:hypothetical protein